MTSLEKRVRVGGEGEKVIDLEKSFVKDVDVNHVKISSDSEFMLALVAIAFYILVFITPPSSEASCKGRSLINKFENFNKKVF